MNIRDLKDRCAFHITRANKEMVDKAIKAQFIGDKWCKEYFIYYGSGRELYEGCGWVHVITNTKIKGIAHFVYPKKNGTRYLPAKRKSKKL